MNYFMSEDMDCLCYIEEKTNNVVIKFFNMPDHASAELFTMFAMNKPFSSDSGVIYSMDDLAVSLTGFGDGRKTKANFSEFDRGFSDAKKCLK